MAAFNLKSETNQTHSHLNKLFDFLSDFRNFNSILPHDKIENFQFTQNECSFSIKGITPMTIKLAEKKPFEFILFNSKGLGKFNFNLKVHFIGAPNNTGQCKVDLGGDLNPIIFKMAENALLQLINTMSKKLSELQLD